MHMDVPPNRDIKSLRLTCRLLDGTVRLRMNRVFFSANPRNVELFKAIASHDVFRTQVTEIIWDDALLDMSQPDWAWDCRKNLEDIKTMEEDGHYATRPEHVARVQQASQLMSEAKPREYYYLDLLSQQRSTLASQARIRAFEAACTAGCFPRLRWLTVTGATHGKLFLPLYETPMIRALPRGFNHPVPRGWPVDYWPWCPEGREWRDDGLAWQGSRTVMRVLASNKNLGRVVEVCVDAHGLDTGLNARLFEGPSQTLTDFETVLARPNLRHLELDLLVKPMFLQDPVLWTGLLRRTLLRAKGLEHLSLRTNGPMSDPISELGEEIYTPLGAMLLPSEFPKLQHLELPRFYVQEASLLVFLSNLAASLRTLELSFLRILEGSHRTLLWAMRDTLGWRERADPPRVVSISVPIRRIGWYQPAHIDEAVDAFLYRGASNPFGDDPAAPNPDKIVEGVGILQDPFDPGYECPNVAPWNLDYDRDRDGRVIRGVSTEARPLL